MMFMIYHMMMTQKGRFLLKRQMVMNTITYKRHRLMNDLRESERGLLI